MKNLTPANVLTSLRLLGAAALVFIAPASLSFYIVYTVCGATDALDGPVARRTGGGTEFGAKLDSAADLSFYAVMIVRLFPALWDALPHWIWIWAGGIVALRLVCYGTAAVKFHRFSSLHTILNKATGLLMFAVPYMLLVPVFTVYVCVLCAVATAAAAQELGIHLRGPRTEAGAAPAKGHGT